MKDEGRLYELVGEAMFAFMKERTPTFPNVTLSKEDYFACYPWKRALLFVFLTRFLYKMDGQVEQHRRLNYILSLRVKCSSLQTFLSMLICMYNIQVCKLSHVSLDQKQWRNFSVRDYKFCTRMFFLFKKIDVEVALNTPSFSDLPRNPPSPSKRKTTGRGAHKKKKSRIDVLAQSSTSEVDSPVKKVSISMDTFSDDEDDYVLRRDGDESEGDGGDGGDGAHFDSSSEQGSGAE